MRRLLFALALGLVSQFALADGASSPNNPPAIGVKSAVQFPPVVAGGACSQYTAFQTRASLNATYQPYYQTLICNGVTHGWFGVCDAVYVFDTQTQAIALLDLTANAHNATLGGSPTFTAGKGFSGLGASTPNISTGLNSNAGTNFVQNSSSVGVWQGATGTAGQYTQVTDASNVSVVSNDFGSDSVNIFDTSSLAGADSPSGLMVGNRSASAAKQIYRAGSSTATSATTSAASSGVLVVEGQSGVVNAGLTICGSLSAGLQTSLYTDLLAFHTSTGGL